jgi:hypothetical protein
MNNKNIEETLHDIDDTISKTYTKSIRKQNDEINSEYD